VPRVTPRLFLALEKELKDIAPAVQLPHKQSSVLVPIPTNNKSPKGAVIEFVDIRGNSSNQLKDYLKRFWEYHQSSLQAFKKCLRMLDGKE